MPTNKGPLALIAAGIGTAVAPSGCELLSRPAYDETGRPQGAAVIVEGTADAADVASAVAEPVAAIAPGEAGLVGFIVAETARAYSAELKQTLAEIKAEAARDGRHVSQMQVVGASIGSAASALGGVLVANRRRKTGEGA